MAKTVWLVVNPRTTPSFNSKMSHNQSHQKIIVQTRKAAEAGVTLSLKTKLI